MVRLEEHKNVLLVQKAEKSNLRSDLVRSLTDCGAFTSLDEKKTSRELLLKIQSQTLQALDHGSQSSMPPPDNGGNTIRDKQGAKP